DAMAAVRTGSRQIVIGGKSVVQKFRIQIYQDQTITVVGGADYGLPPGLYHPDWNNFVPRFGFAYSPKTVQMVVRGGYGVFTTPEIPNPMFSYRNGSYPWSIPQTFIGDSKTPNISMR